MPPRKGIVKSGNAGNSSKATSSAPTPTPSAEKALFPPGFKWPLSLLNEKCSKKGWKANVVTSQTSPNTHVFHITISRTVKSSSTTESVILRPTSERSKIILPTAVEARHWGAVYALYRLFNNMPLRLLLPPSTKPYWDELVQEHKASAPHESWLYNEDPWAGQAEVKARQAKAAEARAARNNPSSELEPSRSGPLASEFSGAPEVKMATALRNRVEETIKRAMAEYPEAEDASSSVLDNDSSTIVVAELQTLGFKPNQVKQATAFLTTPSTFLSALLSQLSPRDAAIEYLIIHLPECDLPPRFLPSSSSSVPFISSAHSGSENLQKRWIEDKAVKEAGWPRHTVQECLQNDNQLGQDWDLLLAALGQKLVGRSWRHLMDPPDPDATIYSITTEEVVALGGKFINPTHIILPLFSVPIELHILTDTTERGYYPRSGFTPFYVTSSTYAPYIRLFLVRQLLTAMDDPTLFEDGQGFCMTALQVLEMAIEKIESESYPTLDNVLEHVMVKKTARLPSNNSAQDGLIEKDAIVHHGSNMKSVRPDAKNRLLQTNAEVKANFLALKQRDEYAAMARVRARLPSSASTEDFISMVSSNRVTIVVGETGSGKTTQLPQYLLDSLIESLQGASANIIITQPRRLSAIGVAARVSAERLDDGSVAYAVRGETTRTNKTKLLFCTTGIVLRRLTAGDGLQGVTHIIVDEVHERSVDGDFLLLQLKTLLRTNKDLKVIIMSATINHEVFIQYFGGAPLLEIPGHTHPVTDVYLEDIVSKVELPPSARKVKDKDIEKLQTKYPHIEERAIGILASVMSNPQLDYTLIASIAKYITTSAPKVGSILIFLPGVQEIQHCIDALKTALGSSCTVLPLHANLSNDEQTKVFRKVSGWKIIASTNVAETSITIDDVLYVLDTGRMKQNTLDASTGLSRLEETWITRASGRQRRGRAGRTQAGFCYKLYTRDLEEKMLAHPVPEILRVPLEHVSLSVKALYPKQDVKDFLKQAITPPDVTMLEKAWSTLKDLGAIDSEEKLTALGQYLSLLPVDLRLGKMLVFGCLFRCIGRALTMAAILSSKPLFLSPADQRDEAKSARLKFFIANSDVLTDLHAYEECKRIQATESSRALKTFCNENFISISSLVAINTLRGDLFSNLVSAGLIPLSTSLSSLNMEQHDINSPLLKSILLAGLFPRVARITLPNDAVKFDRVQAGTIQRENEAKEFRIYDISPEGGRVFIHPSSVLFGNNLWKKRLLVYFNQVVTSKAFLRDATELPYYCLLLFGGPVSVDHIKGGLTVGEKDGAFVKLRAIPRIGVLVNRLRRLLDAQLMRSIDSGKPLVQEDKEDSPVIDAILALLEHDGMSE